MSLLAVHLYSQHKLVPYLNEHKLTNFLDKIYKTYRRDVLYHNDLHGADVAHMSNLFLNQGNLIELAGLDHIDILSFLTAALCHDLGHDGFTNGYHVNAQTERAICYNDVAVQENYHVS